MVAVGVFSFLLGSGRVITTSGERARRLADVKRTERTSALAATRRRTVNEKHLGEGEQ